MAVTAGIMRILNQNELAGVIGHERAHVKNRDILIGTVAATIAGAISMLATMAQWAMICGGGRSDDEDGGSILSFSVMIIVAPIAPVAAMLIQMAIENDDKEVRQNG